MTRHLSLECIGHLSPHDSVLLELDSPRPFPQLSLGDKMKSGAPPSYKQQSKKLKILFHLKYIGHESLKFSKKNFSPIRILTINFSP